ncbi:hypothetical protein K3G39_06910 [Pontibacter sp. HSC-14F20]|uniref:hypothetical protein n=1 Tax=Pontibacter sp. HSC-14F20 TaxID=2864136 RepID=UPI001C7308E8|nr:hypothetical protein [Pontibacter sp. HSC-14F20]MBX0332963.1 hypothetical protein [Pontibacter sp. HSC-14F20]
MNKLEYFLSLAQTLANGVNTAENENDTRLFTNIFRLYVNNRLPIGPAVVRRSEIEITKSSLELLLKYSGCEGANSLLREFTRQARPEHLPAYALILKSINPNTLDEQLLLRLTRSLRQATSQQPEKAKLIIELLFGSIEPTIHSLNDYEVLEQEANWLLNNTNFEICIMLAKALYFRHRRDSRRIHRGNINPAAVSFYERVLPQIAQYVERHPEVRENRYFRGLLQEAQVI